MTIPEDLRQRLYNAAERFIAAERDLNSWTIAYDEVDLGQSQPRVIRQLEEKKYRQMREFDIAKMELLNVALKIASIE